MWQTGYLMRDDGIAVTGMSCRVPGADSLESFWDLLSEGRSAVRETPPGRWDGSGYGGFLDEIAGFDADFFGISPREADAMDPQQRLALELSWEALEDGGAVPSRLAGTPAGVFVGATWDDYATLAFQGGRDAIGRHTLTGVNRSVIANRVSYFLGLQGPSMLVDTGQSSSLVAVHAARRSLLAGECDLALAGGVNLNILAEGTYSAEKFGALSPDGRCYTFDARANGYVRGEGGGFVLLKPVARALADGDDIYCVLLGSAVNNDGRTDGLTVPSSHGQRDVLRRASEDARVDRSRVQYVELHGTGTKVGDPIEAAALGEAFGDGRPADRALRVGSVKTNIGHLEGAAGVVGLIKTALCVSRGELVPSLNFETAHPGIPLAELRLALQREREAWPAPDAPLIAGVSSFGMGGTNCHMIVAAPEGQGCQVEAEGRPGSSPALVAWPISAKTEAALRAQAGRLASFARQHTELTSADIGTSLATTRSAFDHRAVVLGSDSADLIAQLEALGRGEKALGTVRGAPGAGRLAFMFSGQGSQRPEMGVGLYQAYPRFAKALDDVCGHLDRHLDRPLRTVMFAAAGTPEAELLDQTAYTQPALFAIETALYHLLDSAGMAPDFLIGHSIGEITAAHVAGVMSLPDAAALVTARGRLMQAVSSDGAMVSVQAPEEEVLAALAGHEESVSIAAVNGPTAVVISGDRAAVAEVESVIARGGRKTRRLRVSHAFHSPHMDAMLSEFTHVVGGMSLCPPRLPVISNLTGRVAAEEFTTAQYWAEHARGCVRFGEGIRTLSREGVRTFMELGPSAVLAGTVRDSVVLPGEQEVLSPVSVALLRKDRPEPPALASAVGSAYTAGVHVDWQGLTGEPGRRVRLPGYQFQRCRFWLRGEPAGVSTAGLQLQRGSGNDTEDADGRPGTPHAAESAALRLESAGERETRPEQLADAVRASLAAVLGHTDTSVIDMTRTFKDLGLDSLGAVELRDRLTEMTGLNLDSGLSYDYPTPEAVAGRLRALKGETKDRPHADLDDQAAQASSAQSADDPVVIVGMACRFPGGADHPDLLWQLLAGGADAISPFPADRGWPLASLYDPDPGSAGKSYAREGGFLSDATKFDAEFFRISPREAAAMDPQQRVLLETAWEAIEHAGIDPLALRGERTGVFVGVMPQDYGPRQHEASDDAAGYVLTGKTTSVASGRVAYALGLEGPAITVDTACSSSLVAIHLACQALRHGDCSMALVGGATIMPTPGMFIEFSRQRGLAPDGRCKAFAAAADGTSWSEGAGMLLIERLSSARRHGRTVLARVLGSAVNQDGATNGLSAPSGPAQERVIKAALASAGLAPSDIDAVEAHGTGTALGDPIEARALLATYGHGRTGEPLWLGSLKSNIGHAQAAAGVGGVIKMIMAMRHGLLPKTLHVDSPSPHVDWTSGAVALLTESRPWPDTGRPRRAGVSSFGISGTNAHVILEGIVPERQGDATEDGTGAGQADNGRAVPLVVSARGELALRAQARRLREFVSQEPGTSHAAVAWSTVTTRSALDDRAVAIVGSREEMLGRLAALATGHQEPGLVTRARQQPGKTVFIFPGQGSQWAGMAAGLLEASPVFARAFQACADALAPYTEWSLPDVIRDAEGSQLGQVDVVQPALWAVMVSLAALWESAGVRPDAVVGHSQGEIAAAYVAGALSLDDAARTVALRSRALKALAGSGAMASVLRPADEVADTITATGIPLSIGVINGPSATVVSGDSEAIAELARHYASIGVEVKTLPVDYASHSASVAAIRDEIRRDLAPVQPRQGTVSLYSTLTGGWLEDTTVMDADYWYDNLRGTVRFEQAIRELRAHGHATFVEVSPHPVLVTSIAETIGDDGIVAGTLRRNEDPWTRFLTSAAEVFTSGRDVDWPSLFPEPRPGRVPLPSYAFQRRRYWLNAPASAESDSSGQHPLAESVIERADGGEVILTGTLSLLAHPWVAGHVVAGTVLLPGTAFCELALYAGRVTECEEVAELNLHAPLPVPADTDIALQAVVDGPDETGQRGIAIYARHRNSRSGEPWTRHASGSLRPAAVGPLDGVPAGEVWPPAGAETVDVAAAYERLAEMGYGYEGAFRGLRAAWRHDHDLYAEVALPEAETAATGFGVHPALLDAVLHAFLAHEDGGEPGTLLLPFSWTGLRLHASDATGLRVRVARQADGAITLEAVDGMGAPVVAGTLALRPVARLELNPAPTGDGGLMRLAWTETAAADDAPRAGARRVLISTLAGRDDALDGNCPAYPDIPALKASVEAGAEIPGIIVVPVSNRQAAANSAETAREVVTALTAVVRHWLGEPDLDGTTLVVVTRRGVHVLGGDPAPHGPAAAVWGLVRSAQSEHPGRMVIVDTDDYSWASLGPALEAGVPQLAIRAGRLLEPRLTPKPAPDTLTLPLPGRGWRLNASNSGTLDGVEIQDHAEQRRPLRRGEVRVAIRASGLNFRDALIALGSYPGEALIGSEGAGVVLETGTGVTAVAVGDRVMGLFDGAVAPVAVTDHRRIVVMPERWTFTQAATVPVVFLSAYYGLRDLAVLRSGESVLVHAASGGVGMAALQLARHWGAEVFATANASKWPVLRGLGIDADHIASSRNLEFEAKFRAASLGRGVDVVLNSLAGEFTDASLRIVGSGGRFIEMGKADIRDPAQVTATHPEVTYRNFDLMEVPLDRIAEMLSELSGMFARCELNPLPATVWDVREARAALRFLGLARHTGKIVLAVPPPLNPDGTAVVTGGTGTLGGIIARHLVTAYGIRNVVLASRRGPGADGAAALEGELTALGADVIVAACDAADPEALAGLLDSIPRDRPLTAVVHAAGVLDDATLTSITDGQIDRVFRPKADAAWHLHKLTAHTDLAAFVMFSSVAGIQGFPGQANYAAANTFLDGLAAARRAAGLPAASIAWGFWAAESGMTGHLGERDVARMARGGNVPLSTADALALFDAALVAADPAPVATRLDLRALRARPDDVPVVLRELAGPRARPRAAALSAAPTRGSGIAGQLSGLADAEQRRFVADLVRSHAAAVLGHGTVDFIKDDKALKDAGFDSLTSVELRNRLAAATGLRLPATLVFECPTPAAIAGRLLSELAEALDDAESPEVVGGNAERLAGQPACERPGPASTAPSRPAAMRRDDGVTRAEPEPIAVVGVGCRFPGAATPDDFWELLRSGTDAVREVPADRWRDVPGADETEITHAGFLDRVDSFDSLFFNISPREAEEMDPQQRLFLEVAWEALEDAGLANEALAGSRTGVFASAIWHDYADLGGSRGEDLSIHSATGRALNMVANRLSYVLGLRGPSMVIDSACSSSLLAVHLACQSIWSGESDTAIAGGVNLLLSPGTMLALTKFGGLARDGRCKTFDARADGFGRGEGCGVIVLKPLSAALAECDDIWCVIRGSAANNDGYSNGLTAPSRMAQEEVMRDACRRAGVAPRDVRYVEAHGTGTALGDPIEAAALRTVYTRDRDPGDQLLVGSVKTNIGHLEAAAGIAGFIKAAMCVRNAEIPPSLHFTTPNPHIDFDGLQLRVPTEVEAWPAGENPAAGVSAFGWGGTNVHIVLERHGDETRGSVDHHHSQAGITRGDPGETSLVLLSAATPEALREHAGRVAGHLDTQVPVPDAGAVAVAARRRAAQPFRLAMTARGGAEVATALRRFAEGGAPEEIRVSARAAQGVPKVAFVFPGQGSQWAGMASDLLRDEPAFATAIRECDTAASAYLDWSIESVLSSGEALDEAGIDVVQPVLFAVEVAVAALWRSWGLEPDAVVGHSMGEVAAAHVAGALGLDDAARVICLRSRLLRAVSGQGAMLATELSMDAAQDAIVGAEHAVSVAVSNSPRATVLAGDRDMLATIARRLDDAGTFHRWVKVDVASHSPQMDSLRGDLFKCLDGIAPSAARIPIYSTVRGAITSGAEMDAGYWVDNLRQPVLFSDQVARLATDGVGAFIEISPHPILLPAVEQVLAAAGAGATAVPSLRKNQPARDVMLDSAGALWVSGAALPNVDVVRRGGNNGHPVRLPHYPWQQRRFWHSAARAAIPPAQPSAPGAPGVRIDSAAEPGRHYWETEITAESTGAAQHRIDGTPVVPGAFYAELALAAAGDLRPGSPAALADMVFPLPLVISGEERHRVQTILTETPAGNSVRVFARPGDEAVCVAEANVFWDDDRPAEPVDVAAIERRVAGPVSGADFYRALGEHRIEYGPESRTVRQLAHGADESLVRLDVPKPAGAGGLPSRALLDALLVACFAPVLGSGRPETGTPLVGAGIGRLRLRGPVTKAALVHANIRARHMDGGVTADARVLSRDGAVLLEAEEVELRELPEVAEAAFAGKTASPAITADQVVAPSEQPLLASLRAAASGDKRRAMLQEFVLSSAASVVKLPAGEIDPARPLRGLGIDSIMFLELRNRLEQGIGAPLPATLIWNYPTVLDLVPYLASEAGISLADQFSVQSASGEAAGIADPIPPANDSDESQVPAGAGDDLIRRELSELSARMEEI